MKEEKRSTLRESLKALPTLPPEPAPQRMEEEEVYKRLVHALKDPERDGSIFLSVPMAYIHLGRNVRKRIDVDSASFISLTESIRLDGLIHPVTVVLEDGRPTLKAGFRRFKALETLGATLAPVTIKTRSDRNGDVLQAIENVIREDLDPMDYCDALRTIREADPDASLEAFARRVGLKDRGLVGYYLKAAEWPEDVKEDFRSAGLTKTHVFRLARVEAANDPDTLRRMLAQAIHLHGLTERSAEGEKSRQGATLDPSARAIFDKCLTDSKVEKAHRARLRKLASAYVAMEPNEKKAFAAFVKNL